MRVLASVDVALKVASDTMRDMLHSQDPVTFSTIPKLQSKLLIFVQKTTCPPLFSAHFHERKGVVWSLRVVFTTQRRVIGRNGQMVSLSFTETETAKI